MNVEDHFTVGFMDYPAHHHRPQPGTDAETFYCRGWASAQRSQGSELETQLEFDALLGRDTYASQYAQR